MILNAVILLFLIAMLVLWAQYGLFNALLHTLTVIVAGALALAIWEPLTVGFLLPRMPAYAWGVGLLGPFALLLIGLHVLVDKLAGMNVYVPDLANKIGGGALGLGAGILTAGLVVVGIGFLPVPATMAGYQPYATDLAEGGVVRSQNLWIPVDDMAADFFAGLSSGAFASSKPLATHQPDLVRQSALTRLRPDDASTLAAVPGTVEVSEVLVQPTSLEGLTRAQALILGDALTDRTGQLVVVKTVWNNTRPGTYGGDSTLRLPPTQIRLIAQNTGDGSARLAPPVAFRGITDTAHTRPYLFAIDSDRSSAYGLNDPEEITWIFTLAADEEPTYLLARHLRLNLPDAPNYDAKALLAALGKPAPNTSASSNSTSTGGGFDGRGDSRSVKVGHEGVEVESTTALPFPISKNDATSLSWYDAQKAVKGGKATVKKAGSFSGGQRRKVIHVYSPEHFAVVRIKVAADPIHSLLAGARQNAALLNPISLTETTGTQTNTRLPFAYVWVQEDGTQVIDVKESGTFTSASQIDGLKRMRKTDDVYLYFRVAKGAHITGYQIGNAQKQTIDFTVPAPGS